MSYLLRDLTFIRNLSLTSMLAIACCFGLSELQSQNTEVTERSAITSISHSTSTMIFVEHK